MFTKNEDKSPLFGEKLNFQRLASPDPVVKRNKIFQFDLMNCNINQELNQAELNTKSHIENLIEDSMMS